MGSWIESEERLSLAAKLHEKHRKIKQKQDRDDAAVEEDEKDALWRTACDDGKSSGEIRLCWRDLKHISSRVYTFQASHGRALHKLVLDGIGLSTLEGICEHCPDLIHLSLASNEISDVTGIHILCKLSHLNLLRNNLTHLPPNIGLLGNLNRLEIANNKLVELPTEIEMLSRLKYLNLECNELSVLPSSFGRLKCETVCLNSNNFKVFPDSVTYMPNLVHFSIMANQLNDMPVGIGRLKRLEVFRASRNRITIVPDSIVDITTLKCLYLDSNRLSALPPNLHRLSRLKVLKLDGNVDMIYPPIEIISMGTEEVLRWSRNRLEANKTLKIRQIVQSLEEVLSLVRRHRIGGDLHDSLFEVNNGDSYQFPPDALWSVFIPELRKMWSNQDEKSNGGIKSFAFGREEVEQSLFEFRDAAGGLVRRLPNARFKRCSCVQTGRLQVCIPPAPGWMCERPALVVRMKVAYEENMLEKRRLLEEEKRLADAAKAAEAIANSFLASEDGMIMVREEAEKRMAVRKQKSGNAATTSTIKDLLSQIGNMLWNTELKQIEAEIKDEYINREVFQKKQEVMDRDTKTRQVMKSWLGVSTEEVFKCWRDFVELSKKNIQREEGGKLRDEMLSYEDELAAYELKKLEFSTWEQHWDEFNDMPIWVNTKSKESSYEKPNPPAPPPYPKWIRQNEAESSSDDDSSPPLGRGREAEIELAKKRVEEMRRRDLV